MTNNFIPFCPTDTGTNLLTNGEYAADTDRTSGQKPGVASSKLNNKALRQSSIITSQLAEVTSGQLGVDMLDTGATYAAIFNSLKALVAPLPPEVQKFTSGSGTWNKTYKFFIASGNATAGDTYTNNSVTYTVVSTIASGTILTARGSGAPEVSGTLTKSAGSGDATLTFYAVRAPVSINVEMVGGGGGGGGSNASQGTAGGTGGNTTFGTTLLVANGSGGGNVVGQGPATPPGTASLGTGPLGVAVSGAYGATGQQGNITGTNLRFSGGSGGNTPFGGAGGGGGIANNGVDAATNSGSGGGGGGATSSTSVGSGGGGGAGAYVKATINNPSATYAYAVGAGGTAGTAGTGGGGGGAGAAGVIVVTEHYQ